MRRVVKVAVPAVASPPVDPDPARPRPPERKTRRPGRLAADTFGWEDVGPFYEALAFANRPLWAATRRVTERYDLGPRGAWILLLIDGGHRNPRDFATFFKVGRSLITAEVNRLTDAGLVAGDKTDGDRRLTWMRLTRTGKAAVRQVRRELARLANEHLAADYGPEDMRLVTRMLRDFRSRAAPGEEGSTGEGSD